MKKEIDLMFNYPRSKRNVEDRGAKKTSADRKLAGKFGKEFFDGDRSHGYGGFTYHPRFWQPVIPTFQQHWGLTANSSVLDVGCAKAFMLHDLTELIPGITVKGIDISQYAIENAIEDVKPHVQVASAVELPFPDKSFDVVISVTTLHNLELDDLVKSLQEIERVAIQGSFITVDAYHDEQEKARMNAWNLTAKTVLHVDEWKALFDKVGYTGDFYWFIP
jgi:SAM-dependent methyltransferase